MKILKIFIIVGCIAMMASCSNRKGNETADTAVAEEITFLPPADSLSLPLPNPPASLTDPASRADFVMMHFWDKLDFNSAQAKSDPFMEQNFSNFSTLFAAATPEGATKAVDALLMRASQTPEMLERFIWLADKYLAQPGSPTRNEDAYIAMLKGALGTRKGDAAQNERWSYALQTAMKNRPGTFATDFEIITRDGKRTSLLEYVKTDGAPRTMLVFYDTECENCSRVIEEMKQDPQIARQLEQNEIRVLAVNATARAEGFHGSDKIPAEWEDAAPALTGSQTIDDLYSLSALPVRYIIDKKGSVVAKDI